MLTKARMRLNLRRLYAADGQAVRELNKLAGLLLRAARSADAGDEVSGKWHSSAHFRAGGAGMQRLLGEPPAARPVKQSLA